MANRESCLVQVRSLEQQLGLLVGCGFHRAVGCDMWAAYRTILTDEQRRRANQAEFLDEVEEWKMIMEHYCFVVARNTHDAWALEFCNSGPDSLLGLEDTMSQLSKDISS
eukprot:CAMPEP_0116825404 /NCGR_PEP_ID=MMETSP0418-20121206/1945_1 /TAXON_ID=1158023 /ORGANISM="Astrosyne radiata, Strain 13vi08-1A" /LENGTH=109 /DNA_ID=CAMNT_0004453905 /DNA_START=255 /DNA_END=581 /DNA_ORIENTATION=+